MSQFFVLTDQAVVGPLTGVELRESALAGVLAPDCIVGGSKQGPWHSGIQIGLFSENKVPIPHPDEVVVPTYHVRGMPGAFQGPFKLRELIGFASRGMLPIDAELRLADEAMDASGGHETWFKVSRFRILVLCLNGDLVMLDTQGRVQLRTRGVIDGADASRWTDQHRAPIETIRRIDASDVTTFATSRQLSGEDADAQKVLDSEKASSAEISPSDGIQTGADQGSKRASFFTSAELIHFTRAAARSRLTVAAIFLCMATIVVQQGWLNRGPQDMKRDAVLGQWIADSEDGQPPRFGIAFREDGTCTIFNVIGESWTGDYQWKSRQRMTTASVNGSMQQPVVRSTVDHREPNHFSGPIQESDGYLSLSGFKQRGASIDGHPVRDLFVRRVGDQLELGYLTEIAWDSSGKKLSAGWVRAHRVDSMQQTDVDELHEALASIVTDDSLSQDAMVESPVQSHHVDPAYLLTHFGVPDEARKIFGFEVPAAAQGKSFAANHLVRYGNLVLMMTGDGDLQYLRYRRSQNSPQT